VRLGTGIIGGVKKFPAVMDAAAGNNSNGLAPSYAVPLPAGIAPGELLIMFVATQNAPSASPAGWTLLFSQLSGSGSNQASFAAWYRIADGSEGSGVTVSLIAQSLWGTVSYRIKGGRTPQAIISASSGASPNPPALSPAWGAAKTLWLAALGWRGTNNQTIGAYPSGYSGGSAGKGFNGAQTAVAGVAWKQAEAAGEDPGAFSITIGSGFYVTATIAIRPK